MDYLGTSLRPMIAQRLWGAMFISSTGYFLVLGIVSARVFTATGSSWIAAGVFASQWLLPLLGVSVITYLARQPNLTSIIVKIELISGLLAILVGLSQPFGTVILFLALLARGWTEGAIRTLRIVALKRMVSPSRLGLIASLFNTSIYSGAALGGLVGALLAYQWSTPMIGVFSGIASILAALIYSTLPRQGAGVKTNPVTMHSRQSGVFGTAWVFLKAHPRLLHAYLGLLLITGTIEGFHHVARTVLPIDIWHVGERGTLLLALVSGVAILLGAIRVAIETRTPLHPVHHSTTRIVAVTSGLAMITASLTEPLTGFLSYFAMMFTYEVAFTTLHKELMVLCPEQTLPTIAASNNAALGASLFLGTMANGLLADYMTLLELALLNVTVLVIGSAGVVGLTRRFRHKELSVACSLRDSKSSRLADRGS